MQKAIYIIITLVIYVSCRQPLENDPVVTPPTEMTDTVVAASSATQRLNIHTNNFQELDSSGFLLFPLGIKESRGIGGSFSYKSIPEHNSWNIVFYNVHTKALHLLSERKMLIQQFGRDHKYSGIPEKRGDMIFYEIIVDDYNKDGQLTTEDPTYLFATDREGKNFRQLSPGNHSLIRWERLKSSNTIIMTVQRDHNNDKEFSGEDVTVAFEIDLNSTSGPRKVFTNELENKLKTLYDRDWKRLED
jgi:hypothetical protein